MIKSWMRYLRANAALVLFVTLQCLPSIALSQYLIIDKPQLTFAQSAEAKFWIDDAERSGDEMPAVIVNVDVSVLQKDFIVFAVPNGPSYVINKKETVQGKDGDFDWIGESQNRDALATISVSGERLAGTVYIYQEKRSWIYKFSSLKSGMVLLRKFGSKPKLPDEPPDEKLIAPPMDRLEREQITFSQNATIPVQIDLLIAFTTAAERNLPYIRKEIDEGISKANTALRSSGININLNLTSFTPFAYGENGKMASALD